MTDVSEIVLAAGSRLVDDLAPLTDLADDERPARQPIVDAALDRCLALLATSDLWGRDNQGPSRELWKIVGDLLTRGDLQWRARAKPLGYAGDFTMQADFWTRRECADPLGRLFDRYFQKQQAVEAVRGRMQMIGEAIAERCRASRNEEFCAASVVSGPGIDLELAAAALPAELRSKLRLTLVDIDAAALEHARSRLLAYLPGESIRICRENVGRLARGRRGAELLRESDFIVCPGLLDYLTNPEAVAMLKLFADSLRPGGTFYVGNFAPHCTSRTYMEWIGDWHLIYRTADDLRNLAMVSDLDPLTIRIVAESTGADLFVVYQKPAE